MTPTGTATTVFEGGTGLPGGLTVTGEWTAPGGEYPTYRFASAPAGLATRRQLAARGLAPVGEPVARIVWRRGRRHADLWPVTGARPKRPVTPAQTAALAAALVARRTCTGCGDVAPWCLPTRNGRRCDRCDPATYGCAVA